MIGGGDLPPFYASHSIGRKIINQWSPYIAVNNSSTDSKRDLVLGERGVQGGNW
jgi:hypothetical protein